MYAPGTSLPYVGKDVELIPEAAGQVPAPLTALGTAPTSAPAVPSTRHQPSVSAEAHIPIASRTVSVTVARTVAFLMRYLLGSGVGAA